MAGFISLKSDFNGQFFAHWTARWSKCYGNRTCYV